MILVALYILTIPAANWLIGNVGTVCVPNGPCLIPVAPGIMAPSGVLMIGAALVLRDLVQRQYGARWSLVCIGVGTALSFLIARPLFVLVSIFGTDQEGEKIDITWRQMADEFFAGRDGPVELEEFYRFVRFHPRSARVRHSEAKARQTLQRAGYQRVGRGRWQKARQGELI